MKAILLSVSPKQAANILNGKQTIVIRKTMPKCELPIKVYIYCTKDGERPIYLPWKFTANEKGGEYIADCDFVKGNGKAVAKFTLWEVEKITMRKICGEWEVYGEKNDFSELSRKSCLSQCELSHYIGGKYHALGWHISDLWIFSKPMELSEFSHRVKPCGNCEVYHLGIKGRSTCAGCEETLVPLEKAPSSWCYVE